LSAPPYFLAFWTTLLSTYIADRTQQRGLTIVCCSTVGAIGYIMLATTSGTGPRYAGAFLAAAGIFPCIANLLPWQMNNQGNDTRRGIGLVMLSLIGQCGPLVGTNIYPSSSAPRYVKGHSICAAFMFFVALLALSLRFLLAFENRKLDRRYGTVEEQKANAEASQDTDVQSQGVENYGPLYRYVL
jgi:dipeptide/tripeptide permease